MQTTISSTREIRSLRKDLRRYEELLGAYRAIAVAEREKKTGSLKKLRSLNSFVIPA